MSTGHRDSAETLILPTRRRQANNDDSLAGSWRSPSLDELKPTAAPAEFEGVAETRTTPPFACTLEKDEKAPRDPHGPGPPITDLSRPANPWPIPKPQPRPCLFLNCQKTSLAGFWRERRAAGPPLQRCQSQTILPSTHTHTHTISLSPGHAILYTCTLSWTNRHTFHRNVAGHPTPARRIGLPCRLDKAGTGSHRGDPSMTLPSQRRPKTV